MCILFWAFAVCIHANDSFQQYESILLSVGRCRPDGRRVTLSSLVVSSLNALDNTVNPVAPPYQRKKPKLVSNMLLLF